MKGNLILVFFHFVHAAPFENHLRNLWNPLEVKQEENISKRKSYSYEALTPGVDTDQAPLWTLRNKYIPPKNAHQTFEKIKSKKDGVISSFVPDISTLNFDKILSGLNVKRNDVRNALEELNKIPLFSSLAKSIENYILPGKKEGNSGVAASDRQDVTIQGVNTRPVTVGTVMLLTLFTLGSVITVITAGKVADNNKEKYDKYNKDDKDKDKKEDKKRYCKMMKEANKKFCDKMKDTGNKRRGRKKEDKEKDKEKDKEEKEKEEKEKEKEKHCEKIKKDSKNYCEDVFGDEHDHDHYHYYHGYYPYHSYNPFYPYYPTFPQHSYYNIVQKVVEG